MQGGEQLHVAGLHACIALALRERMAARAAPCVCLAAIAHRSLLEEMQPIYQHQAHNQQDAEGYRADDVPHGERSAEGSFEFPLFEFRLSLRWRLMQWYNWW